MPLNDVLLLLEGQHVGCSCSGMRSASEQQRVALAVLPERKNRERNVFFIQLPRPLQVGEAGDAF
jgi:glycine cleavage system aminomethyltransferase T